MKAKDFVKEKHPTAFCQKIEKNYGGHYFLIKTIENNCYIGEGKTESKAWKDAKDKIIEFD